MSEEPLHADPEAQDQDFREELLPLQESPEHLAVEDVGNITMHVTANLGKCAMLVRDVLALRNGSVLQLDKLAGEMADISVNGVPLARGEVVVLGDSLSVRIAEILGLSDRDIAGNE